MLLESACCTLLGAGKTAQRMTQWLFIAAPVEGIPIYLGPPAPETMQHADQQPYVPPHVVVYGHCPHPHHGAQAQVPHVPLAPIQYSCPQCGKAAPTRVRKEAGPCTWILCASLFFAAFPCCLLPFCWCCDCDKDTVHRCRGCGIEVARVRACT